MEIHKQLNDIAFEALFNNATIGIITADNTGTIVLANPYALFQFGYKAEELIGQRIEKLIPGRFAHGHEHKRDNYIRKPQSRPMGVGLDLFAKRRDDSEFPVEISLSSYKLDTHTYVIAFIIDISVRKESERNLLAQQKETETIAEQLKQLNEQLEQKVEDRTNMLRETLHELEKSRDELAEALEKEKELNDLKSRFVSMASHEFRTPLSTILSSVSLIDSYKHEDEQEKRQKHIHRIKDQVRNLSNILEEFLSLGRLEEGLVLDKKEDFDLRAMITELISEMASLTKHRQKVLLDFTGSEKVFIDKSLLRNILLNLISNALKYSLEASDILISVFQTADKLSIHIKDSGMGISEEDLKHLADRFFRGTNAINIQGTGLGLHIVKKYLEVMGGQISFASKLHEGTEVTLIFNQQ
ncbi:MAG: domain S-box protein [Bacteroidetes bacterium]|nr:domain S-box protein [Bacteroidota bacterium]